MTGSPESAFRIFNDVVKNVFEWDERTGSGMYEQAIVNCFTHDHSTCKQILRTDTS